LKETTEIRK